MRAARGGGERRRAARGRGRRRRAETQRLGFRRNSTRRAAVASHKRCTHHGSPRGARTKKGVPARASRACAGPPAAGCCTGTCFGDRRRAVPSACGRSDGAAAVPARRAASGDAPRLGSGACTRRAALLRLAGWLHAAGPLGITLRTALPLRSGGGWLSDHRAAKPAPPLLRRQPISPSFSQAPAPAFVGLRALPMAVPAAQVRECSGVTRAALAWPSRLSPGRPATKPNPDVARAFCLPDAARRRLLPCRRPRKVDHPRCSCGRRGDPQPEAVGDGAHVRMRCTPPAPLSAYD